MQQFRIVKGNINKPKGSVIVYSKYIGKYQRSDLELDSSDPIKPFFSLDIEEGSVFAKWGSINQAEFAEKIAKNKQIMLTNTFYETTKQLQLVYAALGQKNKVPKKSIVTSFKVKNESKLFTYVEDVVFAGHYSSTAVCDSILDAGLAWYLAQCEEARYDIEKKTKKIEEPFHEVFHNQDLEEYIEQIYIKPMAQNKDKHEYYSLKYDFVWSTKDSILKNCPTFTQFCNYLENNKDMSEELQNLFAKELAAILDERLHPDATNYHKQRLNLE